MVNPTPDGQPASLGAVDVLVHLGPLPAQDFTGNDHTPQGGTQGALVTVTRGHPGVAVEGVGAIQTKALTGLEGLRGGLHRRGRGGGAAGG
jgi:hypothetical protein